MKPLKQLKPIAKGLGLDPLNELTDILFSFVDDGFWKNRALGYFEDNKPRVKALINDNREKLIDLIERI